MSGTSAARQTDPISCPLPGHGSNPIAAGSPLRESSISLHVLFKSPMRMLTELSEGNQ